MKKEGEEKLDERCPKLLLHSSLSARSHSTLDSKDLASHDQGAPGDQTLTEMLSANELDAQIAIRSSASVESP